jgi:hypothetical protein
MGKRVGLMLILAVAVSLLVSTGVLNGVSAPATERQEEYGKHIDIEWQREYEGREFIDIFRIDESTTNLIQTSDGGYAFLSHAWGHQITFRPSTFFKVDSSGIMQWNETIPFLSAHTLIQTNDEGYEIAGYWSTYGTTYEHTPTLVKTDVQGNIEWVKNYSSVPDLGVSSASIQTSDGGYAYLQSSGMTPFWGFKVPAGGIVKTDSSNNTQWVKNLTYPSLYGDLPLVLSSLIETSDGALAGLGVGSHALGYYDGDIYLVKTEPFLPLPTQTPLPTPIPTPPPPPTVEAISVVSVIIGVIAVAGLLVFLKKRFWDEH